MPVGFILALSILLQVLAAVAALRLIPLTGNRRSWLFIAAAVLLMAIRRSITLTRILSGDITHPPDLSAELIALTISGFMLIGMVSIAPLFRSIKRGSDEIEAIFQVVPDLYFRFASDGTILDYRAGRESDLYVAPENFLKKKMQDFLPPEVGESFRAGLDKVLQERSMVSFQYPLEIEGDERFFEARLFPLPSKQVISVVRDITLERERESRHRKNEERLSEAQRIAHIGAWEWDIVTNELNWTDEIYRIFGLEPQDFGATYDAFLASLHPDDRSYVQSHVNDAVQNDAPYDIYHRIIRPGGEVRYVRERGEVSRDPKDGTPVRMIGTMIDLTDQNKVERALIESESLIRATMEAAIDPILILDASGIVQSVSASIEDIFGWKPEELIGEYVSLLIPESKRSDYPKEFEGYVQSGQGFLYGNAREFEGVRKDGTHFPCEGTVYRVDVPGQEKPFYAGTIRDLTKRKELEEQLRQSQKLEAVGQLAGGIAHDFNNLLTAINGYADLLLDEVGANRLAREELTEIKRAGEQAASLTNQLLAFGRKQMIQPTVLNLNEALGDMEKMLSRLIGERIDFIVTPEPELGRIRADRAQMEQVILNLALNARDAMPQGGKLSIATGNVNLREDDPANIKGMEPGTYSALIISDTGSGMSAETKARIFEPFYTTKAKGRGTGLGLATVHGIVEQSGGYIEVESAPGEGTTFSIYFPQTQDIAEPPPATEILRVPRKEHETILLVEDEMLVRKLAQKVLEKEGFEVTVAKSAEEAIERTKRSKEGMDLLLTDVVLPGMSGPDLAKTLTEANAETRVLFMSGYTDNVIGEHGNLPEEIEFLSKPFSPDQLREKVLRVLRTAKNNV